MLNVKFDFTSIVHIYMILVVIHKISVKQFLFHFSFVWSECVFLSLSLSSWYFLRRTNLQMDCLSLSCFESSVTCLRCSLNFLQFTQKLLLIPKRYCFKVNFYLLLLTLCYQSHKSQFNTKPLFFIFCLFFLSKSTQFSIGSNQIK